MKLKLCYFGTKGNIYPDNTLLHAATLIDSIFGLFTLGLVQPAFGERVARIFLEKQVRKYKTGRR